MGFRLSVLLLVLCASALILPVAGQAADAATAAAPDPAGYHERLEAYFSGLTPGSIVEKDATRITLLNLQVVQQAIERWASDHAAVNDYGVLIQSYPATISQLVQAGYLSAGLYPNAYTASGPGQLNAVEVPLGWTPQAPGNFSYLADLRTASVARDYVLIGYGGSDRVGGDNDLDGQLDGVCCTLSSGNERGRAGMPSSAMWQGGYSYNVNLMFGSWDDATQEFYYNKKQGRVDNAAATDLAKSQLHNLQLGLERFSVDYSPPDQPGLSWDQQERRYPEAISDLVLETYCLPGFYANPFTAASPVALNAHEVPFGWTEQSPGNFTYLKHYTQEGNVDGYALILWAAEPGVGNDVDGDGQADGTALVLTSIFNSPAGKVALYSGSQRVNFDWAPPADL